MSDAAVPATRARARNWWKIGFFVMLVMFEFAREWAVLASYEPPKIAGVGYVGRVGDFTAADGRWIRTDGGGPLMPSSTRIECWAPKRECQEVSATFLDGYLGTPTLDTFPATFTPDAVAYENDNPTCARYSVRIDLKLQKVFALRERKEKPGNPECQNLERRIEMTLGKGFQPDEMPIKHHFVPLISATVGLLSLF